MKWLITTCVVLAILTVNVEAAWKLYGTTGTGGTGGGSTLFELDPTTGGVVSTIGSVGYLVNGLAYDPTSGKLYGGTSYNDPSYNGLIEINMTTGAGTPVGVDGWGLTYPPAVTNITINSAGEMFGWWDPFEDDLVSIDKTTGIATVVGDAGISTMTYGLAFDNSDTLYLVNPGLYVNVYTVDTTTGAASYIGNVTGIGIAHHGDFDPETNLYYGISSPWSNPRSIYVIDISTLSVTSTLPTVDNLHTLAFVPEIAEINVSLDIKPGSCPNPLNPKSRGRIPVAIVGTDDFNPATVDVSTIELITPSGVVVNPIDVDIIDSTQPGDYDPADCYDCFEGEPTDPDGDGIYDFVDGIYDLVFYFYTQDLVEAIGHAVKGDCLELTLRGSTDYGEAFEGSDSMVILKNIDGDAG